MEQAGQSEEQRKERSRAKRRAEQARKVGVEQVEHRGKQSEA